MVSDGGDDDDDDSDDDEYLNCCCRQKIRLEMCDKLNSKKNARVTSILANTYTDADVVCLQEVSSAWVRNVASSALGRGYVAVAPSMMDSKRDQNSVLLLKKTAFDVSSVSEVTSSISGTFDKSVPVANGDLLAITVKGKWLCLLVIHL